MRVNKPMGTVTNIYVRDNVVTFLWSCLRMRKKARAISDRGGFVYFSLTRRGSLPHTTGMLAVGRSTGRLSQLAMDYFNKRTG